MAFSDQFKLDPPEYIMSSQKIIRSRPIAWEGAVRAKIISDADLQTIKGVDKVRPDQRREYIEKNKVKLAEHFVGKEGDTSGGIFEKTKKRPDIVQHQLVLLDDLMTVYPELKSAIVITNPNPYQQFVALLKSPDPIPLLSSYVLTKLLAAATYQSTRSSLPTSVQSHHSVLSESTGHTIPKLFSYLSDLAAGDDSNLQDFAAVCYMETLNCPANKRALWGMREHTIRPLIKILRAASGMGANGDSGSEYDGSTRVGSTADSIRSGNERLVGGVNLQLLYHILRVIYLLSYDEDDGRRGTEMEDDYEILSLYKTLLRLSPKEKTTRTLLATLQRLLSSPSNSPHLLPIASLIRLSSTLEQLKTRTQSKDEELNSDLQSLLGMLDDFSRTQSNFDAYATEIRKKSLRWSPVHKSEAFWRANANKIIAENDGEFLKLYVEILGKGWEDRKEVLAVACHDVGELVKHCPEERKGMERKGLKVRLMAMMADGDPGVRFAALHAVSQWVGYEPGETTAKSKR